MSLRHRSSALLAVALLALAPTRGPAADDEDKLLASFIWRQPLPAGLESGRLYRVLTPAEVYDGSHAFGRDLRVVDAEGRQWPWYLWTPTGSRKFQALQTRRLNVSMVEDDNPYLRLELRVGPEGPAEGRPRHNRITLETGGADFIRKVEILGGADRDQWGRLGTGFLIDHRQPQRTRNTVIRYTESDYPFLQVRIHRNARDATEEISLQRVEVGRNVVVAGDWEEVPLTSLPVPEEELEEHCSVYLYETDARQRPVERLTVEVGNGAFARPFRLYGRHSATNDWRNMHSGEFHRLEGHENLELRLSNVTDHQFKLALYHYDDAPLDLQQVRAQAHPRYVVLEAQGDQPAFLYFGGRDVPAPRFDLQRRRGPVEAAKASLLVLGPREDNVLHRVSNIDRLIPWIAGSAVALVSVLVIWVITGMLKQREAVGEERGAGSE